MKKLISGLGLMLAVGFSGAAAAGECTKAKVAGVYMVEATSQESSQYWVGNGLYRVWLNKDGSGRVSAYAESFNGEASAENVKWSVEWDVFPDCTGYLFVDNGFNGVEGYFGVAGTKASPVLMGVIADGELAGKMRAEKVRF